MATRDEVRLRGEVGDSPSTRINADHGPGDCIACDRLRAAGKRDYWSESQVLTIGSVTIGGARLEVKRLDPRAEVPRYHSDGASGLDLRALDEVSAHTSEDGERLRAKLPRCIHAGESMLLGTGIAVAIPPGHEAQVRPRSSLAARHTVIATLGTIDVDYRGEILVQLVNHGPQSFVVRDGDRIAQLVVCPCARCVVAEVEALDMTARGASGLGSTGTR